MDEIDDDIIQVFYPKFPDRI